MPVARKLWQLMVGGSPALLARRLTIWKTICLFIRVPLSRDFVMSTAWNRGSFGMSQRPVASMYSPRYSDEPVVCWHLVHLSALLVEQECPHVVAEPVVLDVHCDDGADAAEGVEHAPYQRAVPEGPPSYLLRSTRAGVRASSSLRTGVLPTLTTCLGRWTDVAGLASSVPPETIQSKHLLMAERCCLTEGRDSGSCSTYAATWMGLMAASLLSPRRSHQSMNRETAR